MVNDDNDHQVVKDQDDHQLVNDRDDLPHKWSPSCERSGWSSTTLSLSFSGSAPRSVLLWVFHLWLFKTTHRLTVRLDDHHNHNHFDHPIFRFKCFQLQRISNWCFPIGPNNRVYQRRAADLCKSVMKSIQAQKKILLKDQRPTWELQELKKMVLNLDK